MSSRDMTINQIKAADKEFGATHTIPVKGFNDGGNKITATYVLRVTTEAIEQLSKSILSLQKEMRNGFAQINSRIDNLENLVVTQFKKHGWIH